MSQLQPSGGGSGQRLPTPSNTGADRLRPVPPQRRPPADVTGPTRRGVTAIPASALPYQGSRAGLVTRFVANTIDAAVVVVLLGCLYLVVAAGRFLVAPQAFTFPVPTLAISLLAFFAILVVYLTVSWATTGRTYGDHVMGLRVVGFRGRLHWAGAFIRAVVCAGFPIGLMWVLVSPANRSLQDVILRTSVVYDWSDSAPDDELPAPDEAPPPERVG